MHKAYGAALRLESLFKQYGPTTAVDDVSLEVRPGEFVTLLGPSGSGKTTTLNMIAGFATVDAGRIVMDDRSIAQVPSYRRNIGMVFQHYALFPHLTVEQNITFPLRERKIAKSERRRRVADVLKLIALEGFESRYPRQLSGGEQQRVALARAIVFEPRLLLMDEPLGALDKRLREALQQEIKRIHRELGITFIYVTHDQDEALLLSDRIAVFKRGRIEQVGTGADLYERPTSLFVADFLGDSNHFPGRIEQRGPDVVCVSNSNCVVVPERGALEPGNDGVVVVRPEKMRLYVNGDLPASGENQIAGIVEDVSYLGSSLRISVRLAGGDIAVARQQNSVASVHPGADVTLGWWPEESVLLPHSRRTVHREEEST
jgi:putative spermidine/putrescine transport system ATP-binding protein